LIIEAGFMIELNMKLRLQVYLACAGLAPLLIGLPKTLYL